MFKSGFQSRAGYDGARNFDSNKKQVAQQGLNYTNTDIRTITRFPTNTTFGLLTGKIPKPSIYGSGKYDLIFFFNRGGIKAKMGSKGEKLGQTPLYKAIDPIMTSSSGRAHTFTNRKQISCAKVGVCAHHHVICQIKIP